MTLLLVFNLLLLAFLIHRLWRQRHREEERRETLRLYLEGHHNLRIPLPPPFRGDTSDALVNRILDTHQRQHLQMIRREEQRLQLLADLSHDLRTPLTAVIGHLEALDHGVISQEEERAHYIARSVTRARQLAKHLDRLFTYARAESGDDARPPEPFDLSALLRETLIEAHPMIEAKAIRPEIRLPRAPVRMTADAAAVKRIAQNLVENALHYGHGGKWIALDLTEHPDHCVFSVSDGGQGFTLPADQLFERRVTTGGTGLGLAITARLVDRLGGRLTAESVPWEQTTFTVTLPKEPRS